MTENLSLQITIAIIRQLFLSQNVCFISIVNERKPGQELFKWWGIVGAAWRRAVRCTGGCEPWACKSRSVCTRSARALWLLFGMFVQKVFEKNLNLRYQQVKNQKKIKAQFYVNLKVDIIKVVYFFWFATRWYIKLWFVSSKLFGQKISKAAIVARFTWRKNTLLVWLWTCLSA